MEVISAEFLAGLLLPFLELLDSEASVVQVGVLGRAPGLVGNTQVEHALRVRVHVLCSELLQGDCGLIHVLHEHNS